MIEILVFKSAAQLVSSSVELFSGQVIGQTIMKTEKQTETNIFIQFKVFKSDIIL